MRTATRKHLLVAVALAFVVGTASAGSERRVFCSDSLVRGTYAGQLQGKSTPPNGPVQEIIGVVIRLYDGNGGVVQWDNVKNSVTGYLPNRAGNGRYRVNDDCTVDVTFSPAPGVTLTERAVIVDGGRELRSITVDPPFLFVTSVQQRI